MRALILAGGLGTRLQSVVPNLPKPMAMIHERPFLEYVMDYWIEQGLQEFYLSIGYLAEKIKTHFGSQYRKIPITYLQESQPLGTGGAILFCLNAIPDKDSELFILNGDTFVELNLAHMQLFHREHQAKATIALREVTENSRYSGVIVNEKDQIVKFCERKPNSKTLLVNAGVYLVQPRLFLNQDFKVNDKFSLEDDFFPKLIYNNLIYGFVTSGRFIDIGIPLDYQKSQTFFQYAQ